MAYQQGQQAAWYNASRSTIMPSELLQLVRFMMRTFLVLLAVTTVIGTAATETGSSVGGVVPSVGRESYAVEAFTCADAIRLMPPTVESPVILQLFNEAYLKMQENFLLVMRQSSPQRLGSMYLVCFDPHSADRMDELFGLPCVTIKGDTRRQLLALRVQMIACLVRRGHDVVVSDNDALWLADPIPDIREIEGDILFQRGVFPREFQDPVYGLTVCTGFALYRAGSEGMDHFLEVMVAEVMKVGSDQMGHNKAARVLGLEWDYNRSRSDMRNTRSTGVGRGVLTALPGHFVVTLLPHNEYTRNCQESPVSSETKIAHCFPRANREEAMKKAKLWLAD